MESTYCRILKYTTMNDLPWCLKIDNDNEHHLLSFGCNVGVSDMAPGFHVREISNEGKVSLPGIQPYFLGGEQICWTMCC